VVGLASVVQFYIVRGQRAVNVDRAKSLGLLVPILVEDGEAGCQSLRFAGQEVAIAAERVDTAFTHALDIRRPLRMPVAHGEGCYYADESALDALERDRQILFRYVDTTGANAQPGHPANPNGSLRAIAGVINAAGNVAGLMPHPERAAEAILGSDDGMGILRSLVESAARVAGAPATPPLEAAAR